VPDVAESFLAITALRKAAEPSVQTVNILEKLPVTILSYLFRGPDDGKGKQASFKPAGI
jgi:hypothetical protein